MTDELHGLPIKHDPQLPSVKHQIEFGFRPEPFIDGPLAGQRTTNGMGVIDTENQRYYRRKFYVRGRGYYVYTLESLRDPCTLETAICATCRALDSR